MWLHYFLNDHYSLLRGALYAGKNGSVRSRTDSEGDGAYFPPSGADRTDALIPKFDAEAVLRDCSNSPLNHEA
jgi:hypothetical protein